MKKLGYGSLLVLLAVAAAWLLFDRILRSDGSSDAQVVSDSGQDALSDPAVSSAASKAGARSTSTHDVPVPSAPNPDHGTVPELRVPLINTYQSRLKRATDGDLVESCSLVRDINACRQFKFFLDANGIGWLSEGRTNAEVEQILQHSFGMAPEDAAEFCAGFDDKRENGTSDYRSLIALSAKLEGSDAAVEALVSLPDMDIPQESKQRILLLGLQRNSPPAAHEIARLDLLSQASGQPSPFNAEAVAEALLLLKNFSVDWSDQTAHQDRLNQLMMAMPESQRQQVIARNAERMNVSNVSGLPKMKLRHAIQFDRRSYGCE